MSNEEVEEETSFRGFGIPDDFHERVKKISSQLDECFAVDRPNDAIMILCRILISKAYRSYDSENAHACVRLASSLIQKANDFEFKKALKKKQKQD